MHFKNNGKRLDQFCRCGRNLTLPQIRAQVRNRRISLKTMPRIKKLKAKSRSHALGFVLAGWAILSLALLPTDTLVYAATEDEKWGKQQTILENIEKILTLQKEIILIKLSQTNNDKTQADLLPKILYYADKYGVDPSHIDTLIQCESGYNLKAVNKNSREVSRGISQINTLVHPVSKAEAENADFSIEFMAKHLSQGKYGMWRNCALKHGFI